MFQTVMPRQPSVARREAEQTTGNGSLTVKEVGIFCGLHWRAAKAFCVNVGGVRTGSYWQLPIERLPPAYHLSRGISHRFLQMSVTTQNPLEVIRRSIIKRTCASF